MSSSSQLEWEKVGKASFFEANTNLGDRVHGDLVSHSLAQRALRAQALGHLGEKRRAVMSGAVRKCEHEGPEKEGCDLFGDAYVVTEIVVAAGEVLW